MAKEYVEERNGGYYVAGTRVSLDSIVHAFRRGESPETMAMHFKAFLAAGGQSAGVVLVPQSLPVRVAIEELLLVWAASEASERVDQLSWIPL